MGRGAARLHREDEADVRLYCLWHIRSRVLDPLLGDFPECEFERASGLKGEQVSACVLNGHVQKKAKKDLNTSSFNPHFPIDNLVPVF